MKKHAYVIPYTTENGKIKVAIAKKEALSYEAILAWSDSISSMNCHELGCQKNDLEQLKNSIQNLRSGSVTAPSIISEHGEVKGLDKRFKGLFLPAWGKATFLGGGMDEKKDQGDYKETAIREFIEECSLVSILSIDEKTIRAALDKNLREIWHCKKHSFMYFALDFDKFIAGLGVEEKLSTVCSEFNEMITHFHENLDALPPPGSAFSIEKLNWLKEQYNKNGEHFFPELREIKLYPISSDDTTQLFAENGKTDLDYIEAKIRQFVPYFCELLGCQNNLSHDDVRKYDEGLIQQLLNHAKMFEKIDWHQIALQKFQTMMCANMPPTRLVSLQATPTAILWQPENPSEASCSFSPSEQI